MKVVPTKNGKFGGVSCDYNITTISANRLTESRVSTQIAARAE